MESNAGPRDRGWPGRKLPRGVALRLQLLTPWAQPIIVVPHKELRQKGGDSGAHLNPTITVALAPSTLDVALGGRIFHLVRRPRRNPEDGTSNNKGSAMQPVRLILVGGFLGAGKTTLLAEAARRLVRQGKRVGLVTNDQAANLVDTALLQEAGFPVEEVAGGCFCCRFDELVGAAERLLAEHRPDVLLGEPVGSCTDLSATVLQPVKDLLGDRFRVAPFTVLTDPGRLAESQPGHARIPFPQNVRYIFRKQLEEADAVVINKADTLPAQELQRLKEQIARDFPGKDVLAMSAAAGDGVEAWLEYVGRDAPAGRQVVAVDYDEYAAGEAALGWLNAAVQLQSRQPETDWRRFAQALLQDVWQQLQGRRAEVAHLKLRLTAGAGSITANLTRNDEPPQFRGAIAGAPRQAVLVVNARAHLEPEQLQGLLQESLIRAAGTQIDVAIADLRCFAPGRPQPTHRYNRVAGT